MGVVRFGALLSLLLTSPGAQAGTTDALQTCAALRDDVARLECFDRVARQALTPVDAEPATEGPPAPQAAPTEASAETRIETGDDDQAGIERFGKDGSAAATRRAAEDVPDEISATITRIEEAPRGQRTVYLDNGQVWRESSRNRKLALAVGDPVRIKSGLFGAYKLLGPDGKRYTRASRVE